ncbi:MFS transporter [Rhodoferax mekongensis]|uniref:MFS transporter n=1 Tax=Rhodoferax mekongensis TaxID=3068341 RepID=A0ABZ0B2I9_9BURK|nr:MFS transporter [Rhodoferax sp. TBRC 17307]WNO06134.1 MFS transporter [Rhodoferax sp. TBRC 17307]
MSSNNPTQSAYDWHTITALNIVSTLAQIGQFGIIFVIVPVWLALQGLSAAQLGFFAASLWMGQMPGLVLAPWLCRHWGARTVVVAGLACSVVALVGIAWVPMASLPWPAYLACGVLAGLGMGLRWVGLEPWLYNIAPAHARGRLVGFHETLIAAAPVVAPAIAAWVGVQGHTILWVGVGFTVSALVPLAFARTPPVEEAHHVNSWRQSAQAAWPHRIFRQGLLIALCGGMLESALAGLFAVFAGDRGFEAEGIAHLLTAFGLGGLLLQYPVGWMADHWGLRAAGALAALGTALAAALLALASQVPGLPGVTVAFATMFVLGGLITAFLTLALISATKTPTPDMAWNVSSLSMAYSLSAVVGPVVAGGAMTATSSVALMWFAVAVGVVMMGLLLKR